MNNDHPKILILSRNVWKDTEGYSSTLSNIFADYDPDKLAHLYIETKQPATVCCRHFFQISEFALIKKVYRWRTKTGKSFDSNDVVYIEESVAQKEASTMNYVRGHRSIVFSFLRELLWLLNGWKSKELKQFILEFNPDVIWLDGSPLILMNRLYRHVLKIAKKPAAIFLMDDVYTYESCYGLGSKLYKFFLRKQVKSVVGQCGKVFVISPKMKREYDQLFCIDSIFITKGIMPLEKHTCFKIHKPIRMVYLGQIFYGRLDTLNRIVDTLLAINKEETKIQFSIYTSNQVPVEVLNHWQKLEFVCVKKPVPYNEVPRVIEENDVLVFVESFEKKTKNVARLSFSTKITDYLASDRCIMGIGPSDIAPIEYLREEDAAIIVSDLNQLEKVLSSLNEYTINRYAEKAYQLGIKNHGKDKVDKTVSDALVQLLM